MSRIAAVLACSCLLAAVPARADDEESPDDAGESFTVADTSDDDARGERAFRMPLAVGASVFSLKSGDPARLGGAAVVRTHLGPVGVELLGGMTTAGAIVGAELGWSPMSFPIGKVGSLSLGVEAGASGILGGFALPLGPWAGVRAGLWTYLERIASLELEGGTRWGFLARDTGAGIAALDGAGIDDAYWELSVSPDALSRLKVSVRGGRFARSDWLGATFAWTL